MVIAIKIEAHGTKEMLAQMRALMEGPYWPSIYNAMFTGFQSIFKERFENRTWAPKKREWQSGDPRPLFDGRARHDGRPSGAGFQLFDSLTQSQSLFGIRKISKSYAEFGTTYPWAKLLSEGGEIQRNRVSIAEPGRYLRWTGAPGERFPGPRRAVITRDSKAKFPPRPFLAPLTTYEVRRLNVHIAEELGRWIKRINSMGWRG